MDLVQVTLAFEDQTPGYEISPARVPLGLLNEISADFAAFVKGEDEVDPSAVEVAVVKGSFALATKPFAAPSLARDLRWLGESSNLSRIHPRRRKVLERWQAEVRKGTGRRVLVRSATLGTTLVIDSTTNFRAEDEETWVTVERYVHGELTDLGGSSKPNAHIKLPDGQKLVVRTDRELIRLEKENLVYHQVHLRIRAKYNLDTGELKDPVLIEFVDYAPSFDEAAHARLTQEGEQAWGDIDDAAEWVRHLRGSDA